MNRLHTRQPPRAKIPAAAYSNPIAVKRPSTMRAAIITAPGQVSLDKTALPKLTDTSVRVALEGCGICGSNLPLWAGRSWFKYPLPPGAPGHEGWGRIEAVGPAVRKVRPGQRVALLSYRAFAEYDVADESEVVPLPPELDGKPFPGEALGCAFNVARRAQIKPWQTVAIVGVGFLGALLTLLARRAGARVFAIARRPFALDIARAYGADETIAFDDPEGVPEKIRQLTSGRGCDRVIEATGQQAPLDLAGEITCERGRLVIAGYHQEGPRQINLQLWNWRGLDVINAHERSREIYIEGMQAAVEAVALGELDPTPLYTHCVPFGAIGDALNCLTERPDKFLKALVTL